VQRVVIIGCSGSGKSTLARRLAAATGLPAVHLDRHYWRPGWVEPARQDWRAEVARLAAGDRWIIDGQYGGTLDLRLARADTLIFLDLPMPLCLARVLRRTVAGYGRNRAELPPGCPERFDWPFLKYVWNYRRSHRPKMHGIVAGFGGDTVVLTSPAAVDDWLAQT
jgi:adenylate kinase family enzyme